MNECMDCKLCKTRRHIVVGRGNSWNPYVVVIGEAPGRGEDTLGVPFIGPSGKLLESALIEALNSKGMKYETLDAELHGIYFTNVVRCRPTDSVTSGNRSPEPDEVSACLPKLKSLLETLKPRVIVRLGLTCQTHTRFLETDKQYKIINLPHPAALLRRGGTKAYDYVEYVQKLKEIWR